MSLIELVGKGQLDLTGGHLKDCTDLRELPEGAAFECGYLKEGLLIDQVVLAQLREQVAVSSLQSVLPVANFAVLLGWGGS